MGIIRVPHEASPLGRPGEWQGTEDLLIRLPGHVQSDPHILVYFDETTKCRREFGGPEVPGPWAFVTRRWQQPESQRPQHFARAGDVIEIAGRQFELRIDETVELIALDQTAGVH